MAIPTTSIPIDERPRSFGVSRTRGDAIFRGFTSAAGIFVFLLIGSIAVFLVVQGWPAIQSMGIGQFLTSTKWQPVGLKPSYGVAGLLYYTLLVSAIAMFIAVPHLDLYRGARSTSTRRQRLRSSLYRLVDLLAAFPSIIFGLWGLFYVMPNLNGTVGWIARHFGRIPIFKDDQGLDTNSIFMAAIVLAIMIVPITTSVVARGDRGGTT